MKKGIINKFTLLLISFFILPSFVKAAGSVSASISGGGTVKPGDTVTIYINVGISSNPDDGAVYAFQGTLNYDSEYLEYQSINGASGWTPSFNSGSRKFILGNYGLNAGVKNGSVGSIKRKYKWKYYCFKRWFYNCISYWCCCIRYCRRFNCIYGWRKKC